MKAWYALLVAGGCMTTFAAGNATAQTTYSSRVTRGTVKTRPAVRKIARLTLEVSAGSPVLAVGSGLQIVARATYSDGSSALLPDAQGNAATAWESSDRAIVGISRNGYATALSAGAVHIMAAAGSLAAQPLLLTVNSAVSGAPPAKAAAEPATNYHGLSTVADPTFAQSAVDFASPVASEVSESGSGSPSPAGPESPESPQSSPNPGGQPQAPTPESPTQPLYPGPQSVPSGPVPAAPAGPLPDNFVGPFWTTVSPAGGSASISNAHLFLGVPGGANHDAFSSSNQAVRVVQPIGNVSFDVAIKIDSPLVAADGNTCQGLMVLAANGDFLTFALTTDGTRVGLVGRTVVAGAVTTVLDDSDFSEYQNPTYLRLQRSGSSYVAFYSVDGASWKQAASFSDSLLPATIGPFASNASSVPGNATPVVMAVNWFEVQ